jgi:hypothetical protein
MHARALDGHRKSLRHKQLKENSLMTLTAAIAGWGRKPNGR